MRRPYVTFIPVSPAGRSVQALLGDGQPDAERDGGWSIIDRPKRKGFLEWTGRAPISMDVPIVFDHFKRNLSVEGLITSLTRFVDRGDTAPGTVLRIRGPLPYTSAQWVISTLSPGESLRRHLDGARVRAFFTVTLLEYVTGDVLGSPAQAAQQRQAISPGLASTRAYTVKQGDNLMIIAALLLGSPHRWHHIADLNGISDPHRLKVGQLLRIPSVNTR